MLSAIAAGEAEELPVVLKTDMRRQRSHPLAMEKLATDRVRVRLLTAAVGAINESNATRGSIVRDDHRL